MRSKRTSTRLMLCVGALALTLSAGHVSQAAKLAGGVVAVPASSFAGYGARTAVILQKSNVTFYNYDIARHDVISDNGLFSTPLIGLGKKALVNGAASLPKGNWKFHCSLHPNMKGSIIVR